MAALSRAYAPGAPLGVGPLGHHAASRDAERFVGRVAELRALRAAFERTLRGEPAIALVHGESGIGKSALLARLRADLEAGGQTRVLAGQCYERENTPYKVFDDVIATLVQLLGALPDSELHGLEPGSACALQRVFPAFSALHWLAAQRNAAPKAPKALRELAFSTVRALLCRLRRQRPLVLIIDDLQWGDADSVRLLQHLLSPPDAPALLFVGAYRRGEQDTSPFLQRALADGALASLGCQLLALPLDALADEESLALARAAAPAAGWPPARVEACVRAARGVPFVLRELIAHALAPPAALDRTCGAAASLSDVLTRRAARCSAAARALLDVLCVAGRPLELDLAAWVARAPAGSANAAPESRSDVHAAAAELCAADLARWRDASHGRYLEPYHDLIRRALLEAIGGQRARAVHARLALGMETLALDRPEQLFQHLLASDARERAGAVALVAAQRASEALAWLRAAEWFNLALEHLPEAEAQAQQVYERLGDVLSHAGRHRAAARAFLRGATPPIGTAAARLERLAAQQLLRAGDHAAANVLIKKLLQQVGLRYPAHASVAVANYCLGRLGRRAAARPDPRRTREPASLERLATLEAFCAEHWLSDPPRALLFHAWIMREARRATDRHWLVAQLSEAVQIAFAGGQDAAARCESLLANVDALRAETRIHVELESLAYARAVYLIHCCARPRDALVLLREAEQLMSEAAPGSQFERGWLAMLKDYALEITGSFSELVEGVLRRERECLGRDDGYSLQQLLVSLPLAQLIQDQPRAALEFLRTRWVRSERGVTLTDFVAIMRVSSALLYQGDAAAAHASLRSEWGRLQRSGAFCSRLVRENAALYRARNAAALYCATGRADARREAQRWLSRTERSPPKIRAPFRLLQASIAQADGRGRECQVWLERARQDFLDTQGDAGATIAGYRLAQLSGASATQAAASGWLSQRGIRNVQRWISLASPGPAYW